MNNKDFEFNNSEEDKKIIHEENNYFSEKKTYFQNNNNKKENNKNIISIIVIAILVVTVIVLLVALLSKDKSESKNSNNNSSSDSNKNTNEEVKKEDTKIYDVNDSNSELLLNKYLLFKEDHNFTIVGLDGNKIDSISYNNNDLKYYTDFKDLYFINEGVVYKLDDNKIKEICTLEGENYGFLKNEKEKIVGIYNSLNNREIIYLANKDNYQKYEINNYTIGSNSSEKDYKEIYNDRFIIIIKSNSFGIYDVKDNKEMVEAKYDKIEYLNNDYFAAKNDENYGIIDKNDKVVLKFDYDAINYSNGLYFAINNDTLKIFDSKLNELTSVININNSLNRLKVSQFGDKVIYLANRAIAIDNKGSIVDLDFDNYYVYGTYLITSKDDSTIVTLYDKELKEFGKYDTKTNNNNLEESAIFLSNVLILNGGDCFDLKTGKSKGHINLYRRTSQDYLVTYEVNKDGKITISYNDEILGEVTGVKLMDFLTSNNNGINITKEYFIFNAGKIHYITKNIKDNN